VKAVAKEAKLKFLGGTYEILEPGDYVRCAVTGTPIPLGQLRYWSVEKQEAYASPEAVLQARGEHKP
jgi:hypothetical protein